jgi:hypothetical protein
MTQPQRVSLVAVLISYGVLVVGLLTLSVHPVWGVLLLLGAMGSSLQLVADLCGAGMRGRSSGDGVAPD